MWHIVRKDLQWLNINTLFEQYFPKIKKSIKAINHCFLENYYIYPFEYGDVIDKTNVSYLKALKYIWSILHIWNIEWRETHFKSLYSCYLWKNKTLKILKDNNTLAYNNPLLNKQYMDNPILAKNFFQPMKDFYAWIKEESSIWSFKQIKYDIKDDVFYLDQPLLYKDNSSLKTFLKTYLWITFLESKKNTLFFKSELLSSILKKEYINTTLFLFETYSQFNKFHLKGNSFFKNKNAKVREYFSKLLKEKYEHIINFNLINQNINLCGEIWDNTLYINYSPSGLFSFTFSWMWTYPTRQWKENKNDINASMNNEWYIDIIYNFEFVLNIKDWTYFCKEPYLTNWKVNILQDKIIQRDIIWTLNYQSNMENEVDYQQFFDEQDKSYLLPLWKKITSEIEFFEDNTSKHISKKKVLSYDKKNNWYQLPLHRNKKLAVLSWNLSSHNWYNKEYHFYQSPLWNIFHNINNAVPKNISITEIVRYAKDWKSYINLYWLYWNNWISNTYDYETPRYISNQNNIKVYQQKTYNVFSNRIDSPYITWLFIPIISKISIHNYHKKENEQIETTLNIKGKDAITYRTTFTRFNNN